MARGQFVTRPAFASRPEVPIALLRPVLDQYEPVFQPNAFLETLPETYKDAGTLLRKRMQGG